MKKLYITTIQNHSAAYIHVRVFNNMDAAEKCKDYFQSIGQITSVTIAYEIENIFDPEH